MTKRYLDDYLQDILDAIAAIEQFTVRQFDEIKIDLSPDPSPTRRGEIIELRLP